MNKLLDQIVNRITNDLEVLALNDEYKLKERQILSKILKENSFFNLNINNCFRISDLLLASVIINDKYDDINEVIEQFKSLSNYINTIPMQDWEHYVMIFRRLKEEHSIDEIIRRLNDSDISLYAKINPSNLYQFGGNNIQISSHKIDNQCFSAIDLIKIFTLIEQELFCQIPYIKDIIEEQALANKFIFDFKDELQIKNNNYMNRDYKKFLKESYENYDEIVKQLSRVNDYYVELERTNRKLLNNNRKRACKLSELKKILLESKDKKEITNINSIINLLDGDYEKDVLRYIANKNQRYYNQLTDEYQYVSKNSVGSYIMLFKSKNINFNTFTKKEQQELLKIKVEELEIVFKFLEEIDYDINRKVITVLLNTNSSIINNIKIYIKKGVISNNFVKNNIGILTNNVFFEDPLYDIFISNINVLTNYGINIINLEEKSMNVFIGNTIIILQNLEILDKMNINIKTRSLNDYSFLLDTNLEDKISELNKLDIDINNNIELLNSDFNVIKRIKLCLVIGIDIYNNDKIKPEILNKELFFIPDFKIDEYIDNKKYIKN